MALFEIGTGTAFSLHALTQGQLLSFELLMAIRLRPPAMQTPPIPHHGPPGELLARPLAQDNQNELSPQKDILLLECVREFMTI